MLTPRSYYGWLRASAVCYVAISRASPDVAAVAGAGIVRTGEPWLVPVWHDGYSSLYRVAGAPPLASPPAMVVSTTPAAVTLRMSRPGTTVLRVRWSPLLRATGGAAVTRHGAWTSVTMARPGTCMLSAPYQALARP